MADLYRHWNSVLLVVDFMVLLVTLLTLFHYRPNGARLRRSMGWLAFLTMISCIWMLTFILAGIKTHAALPETIIYVVLMMSIRRAGGNIAELHCSFKRKEKK
ncbi:phage holin family protein [Enterobacter bugandensis]|nr:phage holin family protein [Enterobacter bugandensis]